MTIAKAVWLIAAFAAGQSLPSQEAPRQSPAQRRSIPPAPDQVSVDRGQRVFVQSCGFCHGKDASGGDGGPDLIRSGLVNHDEGGNLIGNVVLNGRPDKGMPSFKMTSEQIADIANFLHARVRSVRYRQLYKVDAVHGNPTAGAQLFQRRCVSCHSVGGDLQHIASKYEPEMLLRRMLYPSTHQAARSAAPTRAQVTVTVTLASGQTFSGPLVYLDEFDVGMYDGQGNYHTWSREGLKVDVHDPLAVHLELLQSYTDDEMHNVMSYLETLK